MMKLENALNVSIYLSGTFTLIVTIHEAAVVM